MIDGPDDAPAPGTPAAPAPVVTDQPAAVDARSAVEKASDEARARIAAGQSAAPPEKEAVPARKPTPRDDETGKFTDQPRRRLPEPAKTEVDPAQGPDDDEPEAGLEPEGGEPGPDEVEEPEEGKEPVEGQPEAEEGFIDLDIPGRREGETVKMRFAEDEAEDIRRLVKGYRRGEAVAEERAEIEEMRRDMADFEEEVELDPGSAVRRVLGNDPDALTQLALQILADPAIWASVAEDVLAWDDPVKYELDASKLQIAANNRREEVRELAEDRRVVSQNLQQVQASVAALIPSDMSEDQQGTFYRDALRDLKEYADRQRLLTLDVRDIPLILAHSGRLRAHGINPTEAGERIAEALSGTRRAGKPAGGKPRTAGAPAPAGKPASPPQKRGKEFTDGSQRRRVAAAAPAGAGSPSTQLTPPPGQTIEERIKWHRDRQQKGKALTR